MLDRKKYNGLPQKISSVADFYKNIDQLYTVDEFNALYDLNFPSNQPINTAIHNLNSPKCSWQSRPRQSFVLKIALKQQKGCRSFYDILRSTPGDQSSLRQYEAKWNLKLNQTLPVTFWRSVWQIHSNIQMNNQFKWLQCQILRYSLYTNNRVSKFKNEVTDLCDLCNMHAENPLTLFWECPVAQQFWSQVRTFLAENTF